MLASAATIRPSESRPSSGSSGRSLTWPTPMMTGMRSGSVMSARFPFGLALLREGQGAFARVLAAHQRGALACVVLPERRVCGDAALVDAERDALRRLHRQRGAIGRAHV